MIQLLQRALRRLDDVTRTLLASMAPLGDYYLAVGRRSPRG
jgi:hypothetical protein